jgi:hypothetical protein
LITGGGHVLGQVPLARHVSSIACLVEEFCHGHCISVEIIAVARFREIVGG